MQVVEVLVWDPFVRIFHWLLASTVLFDWATDEPRWHCFGYLAGVLILLRVLWGFIGPPDLRAFFVAHVW
jgi:cytochrome b